MVILSGLYSVPIARAQRFNEGHAEKEKGCTEGILIFTRFEPVFSPLQSRLSP